MPYLVYASSRYATEDVEQQADVRTAWRFPALYFGTAQAIVLPFEIALPLIIDIETPLAKQDVAIGKSSVELLVTGRLIWRQRKFPLR